MTVKFHPMKQKNIKNVQNQKFWLQSCQIWQIHIWSGA